MADVSIVTLIVGCTRVEVEIPSSIFRALADQEKTITFPVRSHTSDAVISIVRSLLPADQRPSTSSQITYACAIASALGIDVPDSVVNDAQACSDFIETHQQKFNEERAEIKALKERRKAVAALAKRLSKGKAASTRIQSGETIAQVATALGVKKNKAEQYLQDWRECEALGPSKERELVLTLLAKLEAGDNIEEAVKSAIT